MISPVKSPLWPIIERCLHDDPGKRYPNFRVLRAELEAMLTQLTGEAVWLPQMRDLEEWEWTNKGTTLADLGQLQEALVCYDQALQLNRQIAQAWANKGSAFQRLGQLQEAVACYDQALQLNPQHADARYNKALVLESLDLLREALDAYRQFIIHAPEPDDVHVHRARGRLHVLTGQ